MADLLPYATKGKTEAIDHAICQKELPADVVDIAAPEFVIALLERCWQQDRVSRPAIGWCLERFPTKPSQYESPHPNPVPPPLVPTPIDHDALWQQTVIDLQGRLTFVTYNSAEISTIVPVFVEDLSLSHQSGL